jgi:hypothetical protein
MPWGRLQHPIHGVRLDCYLRILAAGHSEEEAPQVFTLGQLIGGTSTAEEPLVITAPGTEINRLTLSD